MPILHKNINNSADIHNPKWFDSANNGDYAWRNELGVLESTDELVLPAALDFVDASVAPPTTNTGDIYVLATGGSVEAGWGAVALKDWVRYDGTDWNEITPQKSTLCYDEDEDELYSYDGSVWVSVGGGDSIYTASGTVPTSVVASITDNLTFDGGDIRFKGSGTGGGLVTSVRDGAGSQLWQWLDDGNVNSLSNTPTINFLNEVIHTSDNTDFRVRYEDLSGTTSVPYLQFRSGASGTTDPMLQLGAYGNTCTEGMADSALFQGKTFIKSTRTGGHIDAYVADWGVYEMASPSTTTYTQRMLMDSNGYFVFGNDSIVSTETFLVSGNAAIKGTGTTGNPVLTLYDDDTTPAKLWQWLDDGNVNSLSDTPTINYLNEIIHTSDNTDFRVRYEDLSGTTSVPFLQFRSGANITTDPMLQLGAYGNTCTEGMADSTLFQGKTFIKSTRTGGHIDAYVDEWGVYEMASPSITTYTQRMLMDSNGRFVFGSGSIDNSALVALTSTTQGFLPPKMTTTQRDNISTPAAGLMVYNTTTNKLNFYNGSAWEAVTSA